MERGYSAGRAGILHQDQPQQPGLAKGSLDGGPGATGQRGDRVDRQDAGASGADISGQARSGPRARPW